MNNQHIDVCQAGLIRAHIVQPNCHRPPIFSAWYAALVLLVVVGLTACSPSVGSTPTAPASQTTATALPGELPTAPVVANGTALAQSQATAIAQAVNATVTVQNQVIATTVSQSVQQTATAAIASTGAVSSPSPLPQPATPAPNAAYPQPIAATATRLAAPGCSVQPVRGFGLLYSTNATVSARLGCPLSAEVGSPSTIQTFESGSMVGMMKQIFVIRTSGATWSVYADNYQSGQTLPTPTAAVPPGRTTPIHGFGLLWEQQPTVQSQLGWALGPEQANPTGAEEKFTNGTMLWTPNQIIEVLFSDNTWQSFPNMFQG